MNLLLLLKSKLFGPKPETEWVVEYEGRTVAIIKDPVFVDQFWFEYLLVPNSEGSAELFSSEAWNKCKFKFRSIKYGTLSDGMSAGGAPPKKVDAVWKITLRGLHV